MDVTGRGPGEMDCIGVGLCPALDCDSLMIKIKARPTSQKLLNENEATFNVVLFVCLKPL